MPLHYGVIIARDDKAYVDIVIKYIDMKHITNLIIFSVILGLS